MTDIEKTRGLSGLNNLGNTCYMNSALQCLSACNILNLYFRKQYFKSDLKNGLLQLMLKKQESREISFKKLKFKFKTSLSYRMYELMYHMWGVNCNIRPSKLKEAVNTYLPYFKGYDQHDGQEFITYFLDRLHDELKTDIIFKDFNLTPSQQLFIDTKQQLIDKLKDDTISSFYKEELSDALNKLVESNLNFNVVYDGIKFQHKFLKDNHSIITDLFYGIYVNIIVCKHCSNKSIVYEPFNAIQLDINNYPENINLEELLHKFFNTSEVENYKCDKCNKVDTAKKIVKIHTLPEKLIIQFKRFIVTSRYPRKNQLTIIFPLENVQIEEVVNNNKCNFKLFGVLNHMGSVNGGHYTAYTRNLINNKWYEFNDSHVSYVIKPEKSIVDCSAYVLFYEKVK